MQKFADSVFFKANLVSRLLNKVNLCINFPKTIKVKEKLTDRQKAREKERERQKNIETDRDR